MLNEIKNIFIKNFFNLSLNQILNVLFTLIITPILFKTLGSDQFGLINLYLTIVLLLSFIIGYGYNLNSPQRLASFHTKYQVQTLLVEILSVRIIISIIILFFSISITPLLNLSINQFYIFTFSLIILSTINLISFNSVNTAIGTYLLNSKNKKYDIAGRLSLNEWNGKREVQFLLDDLAISTD